jgi:Kdo2-lipid IVA lauroyltransferase/acyltransferase
MGSDRATRHTAAHRAEFALVRGVQRLLGAVGEPAAETFAGVLGRAAYWPVGIRRDVVRANLRIAFPDADEPWIDEMVRLSFRHLAREAAVMMRLPTITREEIRRRTDVVGWTEFEAALAQGRGAILVTGHFGNWEIAAAAVAARGVPIAAIVRAQGNRLFDAHLNQTRRRLGVETIYQRDAPRQVPRVLRQGGVVGIVGDQDARAAGVFVPFFGRPASTHRGPALFALRLGAPVIAASARRLDGVPARYEVRGEMVPVERTADLETDVHRLTAELARRLEADVRRAPEQYFWFHKRWKSVPPAEPPVSGAGTSSPSEDASL